MTAPVLTVEQLAVRLGDATVVDGVDFTLGAGERVALLGPSGCGKTTTLRTIAGFERAAAGRITIAGTAVAAPGVHVPAHRRGVGLVFQDLALFPHLTVAANVGFGLPRAARAETVAAMLATVELDGLGDRLPGQLSGGQQQRVALARALAPRPRLLLLDEPFASLDAALRDTVLAHTDAAVTRTGATALLVTHDRAEAMAFADRLLVMRAGRLEQVGPPADLYRAPRNRFVATALGPANLLPADADGATATTALGPVALTAAARGPVTVCVRPEALRLAPDGEGTPGAPVRIVARTYRGATAGLTIATETDLHATVAAPGDAPWRPGDRARLSFTGPAALLED